MKREKQWLYLLAVGLILLNLVQWQALRDERFPADSFVAENTAAESDSAQAAQFYRDADTIDYSGLQFTPWDVRAAAARVPKRTKKPYTIMIYMNGSDLESENGAATEDMIEMLESGVSSENVNIVLFTGGANRWQNDVVPENECVVWEIADGTLNEITGVGLVNMGNAGTLSSFIDFSICHFPADKYGLILWDHGGGAIAGYGYDEKFVEGNLTLLDMNYAFQKSMLTKQRLTFLGFDSCLMATVEMAVVAADYAEYLIAAEDLEPGEGWDYGFLSVLNRNPSIGGAAIGQAIVDSFMDYYGDTDEILTLSVVDLSNANAVMGAMGNLMARCSDGLSMDRRSAFRVLSKKRSATKTFGGGSPRDTQSDMVDIGDMASKLSDLFPEETAAVLDRLKKAVVYNRHNSDTPLSGLSAYYIYGGKEIGADALDTYAALDMNEAYTQYLNNFYRVLAAKDNTRMTRSYRNNGGIASDEIIQTALILWRLDNPSGKFLMAGMAIPDDAAAGASALWPAINGEYVCLHKINSSGKGSFYATPAVLNGKDCDIVVLFNEKHPQGKIMGARRKDGVIVQKGFDQLSDGDQLAFYYQEKVADGYPDDAVRWRSGKAFTVRGDLTLQWLAPDQDGYYYCLIYTDIRHNRYFSEMIPIPAD